MKDQTLQQTSMAPFTVTYREIERRNTSPEGGEYVVSLHVDGASRSALKQVTRRPIDARGPMGLFGDVLPEEQIRAIPAAIDAIEWSSLPRREGSELYASWFTLDYVQGTRIVRREFNARNGAFIKAIDPIVSILDKLNRTLDRKPIRAISLSMVETATGFRLLLRNIGVGPVLFADPREPGPGGCTRGMASIEEARDLAPPPKHVPLAPSTAPLRTVTLPPGGTLELDTVPWKPAPGKYVAYPEWVDYSGPTVAEKDVIPRIPKFDELNDPRPFVLRGGLVSSSLHLERR